MTLFEQIQEYLEEHPTEARPEPGPLTMHRDDAGNISVVPPVPDVMAISVELLENASMPTLSFADGLLTIDVLPEPLYYRPFCLYNFGLAVVFLRSLPLIGEPA